MTLSSFLRREWYVAMHAQTRRFRIRKWIVFACLFTAIGLWKGWMAVLTTLGVLTVVALGVHFLFRWKTKAWTQSWGLYKKIPIPGEG